MGRVIGCQLSNFPNSCRSCKKSWLFRAWPERDHRWRRLCSFLCMLDSGSLKERNLVNLSWPCSTQVRLLHLAVFFINTGDPEWQGKANTDSTLATVTSIVCDGRSRLYISVMVAMVIYHTLCPVGPWYDKSHNYLHCTPQCNLHVYLGWQFAHARAFPIYT